LWAALAAEGNLDGAETGGGCVGALGGGGQGNEKENSEDGEELYQD
jgi:hypothetical protein